MGARFDSEGHPLLCNKQAPLIPNIDERNSAVVKLLILDDWAMIKLTAEQRRDLMEVIDDRHGRASTIIATPVPVEGWHDMIADQTYADAILDRLVHNAYRIELRGESMRRQNAKQEVIHTTKPEKDK